ncbi:MAG: trehalose-phosphatase [Candidatus Omnitrophota bacterium]
MEYLFNVWDSVEKKIGRNNLFIFLDFDGTLAPIASTPDKAVLSESVKKLLKRMSENPRIRLAFISGRQLEDIKAKVGIKNAIYAGNHGLQIEGPKIKFEPLVSSRYRMVVERIKNELEQKVSGIQGAFVEDKGLTLSLHYRLADKKDVPVLKKIFQETVILYLARNKIKVKTGKMVLEVRPPLSWDKGRVVLWLLARSLFASKGKGILPIYIGDDITDEDAFLAIKNKGLAIFIGEPKKSYAQYYLKNHNEVRDFLERILERYNVRINKSKGTL